MKRKDSMDAVYVTLFNPLAKISLEIITTETQFYTY